MNCWIVQCNPNKYRWFDYIKEHQSDPDTWGINLFFSEIERGDTVFIWLAKYKGKETRGIYAMAEVTGLPNKDRKGFPYELQYWTDKQAMERHSRHKKLELKYTKVIADKHISRDELEAAGLDNLLILKMWRATIYKVTQECEIIRRLVESR